MKIVRRLLRCESGATAVEYGLIGTLIGLAIIVAAASVGTSLNVTFQELSDSIGF
jgi:pilus assembly protein Flp/PilA